jgi:OOP family OmpA-OmpF porin
MQSRNRIAYSVVAGAALAACLGTAVAQSNEIYNPSPYVLLNGSVVKPDKDWPADKVGLGGGLKLGVPLSPSWDLQIGGNYARSKEDGAKYHQWLGGADLLYLFTPGGFRPFILAGFGAARDTSLDPINGGVHRTSPYVDLGAGFQYKFTPTFGMQADIREVGSFERHRIDALGIKRSGNTYANVGLTFAFGGPPSPPPAPLVTTERTTTVTQETTPAPQPVMAPPPPPAPAPAPRMAKYTLSANELFGFNSAQLAPNQPKLDEVASVMNGDSEIHRVTIVGYTDKIGSTAYNQKLSVKRAESVKHYLEGKGVSGSRLEAVGKGESDPVVECAGVKKRTALIKCLEPNRRVEIEPVTYTKPAQ